MSQAAIGSEVLTLEEVAAYLRVPERTIERLVVQQGLPGRRIDDEWRFLRSAVQDWLRGRTGKDVLLQQAGELADDPILSEVVRRIYEDRGRPETEAG